MLKVEQLCAGYNKKILIDGLSFTLEKGKILCLIGPNGSGKSTLLKTVTFEIEKLGGKISFLEKELSKKDRELISKNISILTTERIHPELMTCRDVIATGRYPYTSYMGSLSKEDIEIINKAIQMVSCQDICHLDFNKISDGQRQRVMLARAICQDTDIIVLDEPTSFLDLYYKLDFLRTVKNLAVEFNKAILISLHELDLARQISDNFICLDRNGKFYTGTVNEIFNENFIQNLYGLEKDEFNPETGMLNWSVKKTFNKKEKKSAENSSGEDKTSESYLENPKENLVDETAAIKKSGKAKVIMVQGTMSNAGKSLIVAGLCRIFKEDGYKVVPFKSQNMALNSYITKDGFEMGRAQVMQAWACGIEPMVCMNPILLKPTSDRLSQVIVNGKVLENMDARKYFEFKKQLIPHIMEAYKKLESMADIIVIEGAGSPAEINLKENDIVNMGLAELVDAPVLLVGDIDRGGVFAQLLGTIDLLEEKEKQRVKGLIINKFRGDKSLLDSGITMLEEKGGIKVTGVLPYMKLSLDDEDSLSSRFESQDFALINIGVVKLPHISNFTDFNVFEQFENLKVHYLTAASEVEKMDMLILPGSKNTIGDLKWLRESGFEATIKKFSKKSLVFGVCGGYQILGNTIEDPYEVEEGGSIRGLELLDTQTVLSKDKLQKQVQGKIPQVKGLLENLSNKKYQGYEIHMGQTKIENPSEAFPCGAYKNNVYGTYIHGFFDEEGIALEIVKCLYKMKNLEFKPGSVDYKSFRESQYDFLAAEMRKNLDMEAIYAMLNK